MCKRFAKLTTKQVYEQKNPNQGERWVRVLENGFRSKVLSAEELKAIKKESRLGLMPIPLDYHLVNKTYIEELFFASTVAEAHEAMDTIRWDRFHSPEVVWWYFESAVWCWKTTECYLNEIVSLKNGQDSAKHFQTTCNKIAWTEISSAKRRCKEEAPIIFTDDLFIKGLRTLINTISVYLSEGRLLTNGLTEDTFTEAFTSFELILEENVLWMHVTFENRDTEKFFVQKFYEVAQREGSYLRQFVQGLFDDPEASEKKATLKFKWESAAKHLNRIHLPKLLKKEFFFNTHGSYFHFQGTTVKVPSTKKKEIEFILAELRKRDAKRGKGVL